MNSLFAPACKHIICMMMVVIMVVIMSAAAVMSVVMVVMIVMIVVTAVILSLIHILQHRLLTASLLPEQSVQICSFFLL